MLTGGALVMVGVFPDQPRGGLVRPALDWRCSRPSRSLLSATSVYRRLLCREG